MGRDRSKLTLPQSRGSALPRRMETLTTEVLVVGGGTGGTAAALQAARRGAQVTLVSEFPWLGGMLTSAGVSAPDGNELVAFQTGIWGHFLQELRRRQPGGLNHAWVSFFTYEPAVGAAIFADWARSLPNLHWISGQVPREVIRQGDRLTGVRFDHCTVNAQIILDGTELGDLLALGDVPHAWGWEWQAQWQEPSAPVAANPLTERYPVQSPTWVVVLQDFGPAGAADPIPPPPTDAPQVFQGAWENYGVESFLNYGRLPGDRFMLNWPQHGNDYGVHLDRLIQSAAARQQFFQEARWHSQSFARFLQQHLGRRYGLADDTFPQADGCIGGGAYALHPYFRESRRLRGRTTVREQDILPQADGQVARLPVNSAGRVEAIALGNYANDHHYPDLALPLQPKSLRWGGRWTGTPFALPYRCLVPQQVEGLLVCEKNISVSHVANGATRLQPVVLGLGQAAGMAAALCVEQRCQPAELPVEQVQEALLTEAIAPAALVPLFNLPPSHPDWLQTQRYYLNHPEDYPTSGNCPIPSTFSSTSPSVSTSLRPQRWAAGKTTSLQHPLDTEQSVDAQRPQPEEFVGLLECSAPQDYRLNLEQPKKLQGTTVHLVTVDSSTHTQLLATKQGQKLQVSGQLNTSGRWILAESVTAMTEPS